MLSCNSVTVAISCFVFDPKQDLQLRVTVHAITQSYHCFTIVDHARLGENPANQVVGYIRAETYAILANSFGNDSIALLLDHTDICEIVVEKASLKVVKFNRCHAHRTTKMNVTHSKSLSVKKLLFQL